MKYVFDPNPVAGEDDADAYMSVVELDYSVAMCC